MIDFKKICSKYYEEALQTLKENIRINSIYDPKTITNEMPYGKGVSDCFKFLKEKAIKDGFEVDECDGRCIEISYGEGEEYIGIFAHQDVVPINGKWVHEPFGAIIEDEKLYGRGTSDDKGPGISAYYALKALKDNNLINGYKIKLVFGGDEERGSSCLDYYFNKLNKPYPKYGFTPDGDFPLIYGEKGITNYEYKGRIDLGDIIEIHAGTVSNSVIDEAKVILKNSSLLDSFLEKNKDINYKKIDDNTFIFIGKPAHGSTPEEGFNSGILLLSILGKIYNQPVLSLLANEYIIPNGRNLYACYRSEDLGETTYNVGIIKYKDGLFQMVVNFRYPENVNSKEVIEHISKYSPLPIYTLSETPYLYFNPRTTKFIKCLMNVYQKETGDYESKPMAIGGGTYAKEAKNTVAFGSHFPGKIDNIHGADEKIDLEDFYSSISLYARAMYELGNLNEN